MNIAEQRTRALEIIKENVSLNEATSYDYWLDSICREILNLPKRPDHRQPYDGWLVGKGNSVTPVMVVSQAGLDFIKEREGFRSNAYQDEAGVWTIGYGHIKGVKQGMTITEPEALELFHKEVKQFANGVRTLVEVPVDQNQFDALVSFAYNVGLNAFRKSTLLDRLNAGKYHAASRQFERWVYAGGKKSRGLEKRRQLEKEMFLKNG